MFKGALSKPLCRGSGIEATPRRSPGGVLKGLRADRGRAAGRWAV